MGIIHLRHRAFRLGSAALLVGALTIGTVSGVSAANGNNGTVKIQQGSADADPITRNEPHCCTFHMLFLFADVGQSGDWSIDQQAPTGNATNVLTGSYDTGTDTQYKTGEYGLPVGHYTLNWQGRNDQNVKHKTFWVTCGCDGDGGGGGVIGQG